VEKVKLHRCRFTGMEFSGHACWKVQHALDDAGVPYEIVKAPTLPRSRRKDVIRLTGQSRLPVVEFADGTALREESDAMAARIREGRLFEGRPGGAAPAAEAHDHPHDEARGARDHPH
jgi:glutathione S-transferase